MGEAKRRKQAGASADPKAWREWRRNERLLRGHANEEIIVHGRHDGPLLLGEAALEQAERDKRRAAVKAAREERAKQRTTEHERVTEAAA